ncbi:hypothetical protein VNO77_22937 [Canavalia gladiata]|uniref:Calmodulin binding protein C-terminal domain-containing protein n=1 Tax=Canavalia gladiata TaxID=3824 RepID=A0AAN9L6U8_CANGL
MFVPKWLNKASVDNPKAIAIMLSKLIEIWFIYLASTGLLCLLFNKASVDNPRATVIMLSKLIEIWFVNEEAECALAKLGHAKLVERMWENIVEDAKTCVLGGKLFVYYTGETNNIGIMFNDIYELTGFIADSQFFSLESLTPNQKMFVDSLVSNSMPLQRIGCHMFP